jgi:serine/threonine protein kinase
LTHSFDRVFQAEIPLPLARLYARAYHAKGERERHDQAFHLLEASLKLCAAALVARYRLSARRSARVDAALEHLAMPSLGQWRDLFRETLAFLAGGDDGDPWARKVHLELASPRGDGALFEAFSAMARAASYRGRASARVSSLDLLELLPSYRNSMSDAHGSIKADPAVYRDATPALMVLARALLDRAALLGGGRLVYAEDVRLGTRGERRVIWVDLSGPTAVRRQALEGEATAEAILPGRLYLESGPAEHLPLHPLVYYQSRETLDQVFFLNRARSGRGGIQFLSYETGEFYEPGRDPTGDSLVTELEEVLSWATSRRVDAKEREALAARSDSGGRGTRPEDAGPGDPALEAAEPAGRVFGDFEILGELGRGGMAVVYQARQRSLGRLVALKVLPPALKDDPVALARFQREVRALSRCDHPNVVKILSSGEAGGTCYYAMELIDGSDLAAIGRTLKRYRSASPGALSEEHFDRAASTPAPRTADDLRAGLPEAERVEQEAVAGLREGRNIAFRLAAAIRDAARGLQHIHDHGIVHRDLKPQNIMVTREEHRPVVMDLGLAKVTGASQSLTLDRGSILGTLRYMPPEQLQRNLLEVDARADVYALGAVLYELACLRPMLDGDTEERLTTQILFEEPPPPQKVSPLVPTDLATVISKATRKDPRERYASAGELADDLDRFIHGEAIGARPPTLGYLLRLFLRRHRAAVAAAALGLMLLVLLVAGWIVSLRSSWEKERLARVDEKSARETAQGALVKSEEALARANRSLAELFLERADRALEEKAYQRAAVLAAASLRTPSQCRSPGRSRITRSGIAGAPSLPPPPAAAGPERIAARKSCAETPNRITPGS